MEFYGALMVAEKSPGYYVSNIVVQLARFRVDVFLTTVPFRRFELLGGFLYRLALGGCLSPLFVGFAGATGYCGMPFDSPPPKL